MTTTVIVKTHDWPVQVLGFPLSDREPVKGAEYTEIGRVEPNSEQEFHVHAGQDVLVKELPIPEGYFDDEAPPARMTIGEFRVGIDFNPSQDDLVGQIKRKSADLIDLIEQIPDGLDRGKISAPEVARTKALAQTAIEDGAMWAVKAATKPEPEQD